MLHVHVGDSSAAALRNAGVPGDTIVWTEVLYEGPRSADDPEMWLRERARFLSETTGGARSPVQCRGMLEKQDRDLAAFLRHDELVFWFDACLFDQSILARHLDWLGRTDWGTARVTLVEAGSFPGHPRFAGLGELTPAELASLFPNRENVTAPMIRAGTAAWRAIRSGNRELIERTLKGWTGELPYMGDAMARLLEEMPAQGLTRLEREVVAAARSGATDPAEIFSRVSAMEERPYFGDSTLWRVINRLARAEKAPIVLEGPGPLPVWEPPQNLSNWRIRAL